MRLSNAGPQAPTLILAGLLIGLASGCFPAPDDPAVFVPLSPEDYPDPGAATEQIRGVTVGVVGTGVIIENHSVEDLRNVEIVINEGGAEGGFRFYVPQILSNTTNTYLAQVFKSEGGDVLKPMATKIISFALYADTPRGRGYWRGAY